MGDLSGMYRSECANCKALRALVAELEADRDRWKAIAKKRLAILLGLEWSGKMGYGPYCPECLVAKGGPHEKDCDTGKAVADAARAANDRGEG